MYLYKTFLSCKFEAVAYDVQHYLEYPTAVTLDFPEDEWLANVKLKLKLNVLLFCLKLYDPEGLSYCLYQIEFLLVYVEALCFYFGHVEQIVDYCDHCLGRKHSVLDVNSHRLLEFKQTFDLFQNKLTFIVALNAMLLMFWFFLSVVVLNDLLRRCLCCPFHVEHSWLLDVPDLFFEDNYFL